MMLPTLKIVLYESNTLKDGTHPIMIRVTFERKSKYKPTGFYANKDDWDGQQVKQSRPNATLINRSIRKDLEVLENAFLKVTDRGEHLTLGKVNEIVKGKQVMSFYQFADKLLEEDFQASHSSQTRRTYASQLNKLKEYAPVLNWGDITPAWLTSYRNWLAVRGNVNNTQHKAFTFLKKVFNVARVRKVWNEYPFEGVDLPKRRNTMRTFLTLDELNLIEKYVDESSDPSIRLVGAYFLLACFSSFRYEDVRVFDSEKAVQGERLLITSSKTKQIVSIPVHPRLKKAIERLTGMKPCFVNQVANRWLKLIAVGAGVKKQISFHTARHTFAVLHLELGGSVDVLQEILTHEDLRTTKIYAKITNRKVDVEMGNWGTI